MAAIAKTFQQLTRAADHAHTQLVMSVHAVLNDPSNVDTQTLPLGETLDSPELARFFLQHIDHPYPDKEQTRQLAAKLGETTSSVKRFFTNTRRYSGWDNFRDTHGAGNQTLTTELIRRIDQGLQEPELPKGVPLGAVAALQAIRNYVSSGLEEEVREGLEEAMELEMRKIAEEKENLQGQGGAAPVDGDCPAAEMVHAETASTSATVAAPSNNTTAAVEPSGLAQAHPSPATPTAASISSIEEASPAVASTPGSPLVIESEADASPAGYGSPTNNALAVSAGQPAAPGSPARTIPISSGSVPAPDPWDMPAQGSNYSERGHSSD